jgi:hypothetical protein
VAACDRGIVMDTGSGRLRVSVVIPTFNRAPIIDRALASVFAQTHPADEVIIVDDGSTDNTVDVLSSYGNAIRLLHQNHGGPSRARNLGVSAATSPWVAFLDSDDAWEPWHLARLMEAVAATDGRAALYFDNAEWETADGVTTYWDLHGYAPSRDIELIPDAKPLVYREVQPMLLPFTLLRKDVYESAGGLCENLWSAEDTHLFLRLGTEHPFCAVKALGGRVTSDVANSNSRLTTTYNTDTRRRWTALITMYHDLLARFPDLPEVYVAQLNDWLAGSHWRLSRISWKEGKYAGFLAELLRTVRTSPKTLWNIVLGRLGRSS